MSTVIENSRISPPPGTTLELSVPMVFFDMFWYGSVANQTLLFFEFPDCSESHFLDTIVPDLKVSLSLTLTHFLPLAGNIIHPINSDYHKPIIRYESGDSVSFTVSKSLADDFNHLTGNHPRSCDEFYAFAPQLPPTTPSEDSISCPVLALQVTLFPGRGLCIGFITHHAVVDASTAARFTHAWALINRTRSSQPDNILTLLTEGHCLPFIDRKMVTNLNGLDSIYWEKLVKLRRSVEPPPVKLPINKLRTTFVLKKEEIQGLKDLLLAKCPTVSHLSSFTAVCALVWVCSSQSATLGGEEVSDDEPECLGFQADCRRRLKPPLPTNYLGNCVSPERTSELMHGIVKGPDGFVMAAKAIGKAIKENVNNEEKAGTLYGAENWPEEYWNWTGKRQYLVVGSPRFDFYAADYGWGRPIKFEVFSTAGDGGGAISLWKSRDFEGGLEIGLTKPALQTDAFARVFRRILIDLLP